MRRRTGCSTGTAGLLSSHWHAATSPQRDLSVCCSCSHCLAIRYFGTGTSIPFWSAQARGEAVADAVLQKHRLLGGRAAYRYSHRELFTVRGATGLMEMIEVDIARKRLVPLRSLGRPPGGFRG